MNNHVTTAKAAFAITGMTCAACVSRLERILLRQPGVLTATVSLPAERAELVFDPDRTGLLAMVTAVEDAGFGARPISNNDADESAATITAIGDESGRSLVALAVSALFSLPLLWEMVLMLAGEPPLLPNWLQWALATPVQFWAGARFYRGAWFALRSGWANMDVLVSLGTSAAYGLAVWQVLTAGHHGHPEFEAAALVITLVIAGKWLEARARRATNQAVEALRALRPGTARLLLADGREEMLAVSQVLPGQRVLVRPGERIPVDGMVEAGLAAVDESMVTGESLPRERGPGAMVIGGTLNLDGMLTVTTTAVGAESMLGRMIALVGHAQATKPRIERLADWVSGWFAIFVAAISAVTLAAWWLATGDAQASILPAVAVLVVACPCALGLATPAVIAVALGVAARHGILIRDAEVLETAHNVSTVIFDKTGTLTEDRPQLTDIEAIDGDAAALASLAAAVQRGSFHPIARAIIDHARELGLTVPAVTDFRAVAGRGVIGTVGGRALLLGNRALLDANLIDASALIPQAAALEAAGKAVVWIGETGVNGVEVNGARVNGQPRLLGLIGVADRLRPGAAAAIAALLRAGVEPVMLTGDQPSAALATAARLGLQPGQVRAGATPEDKIEEIMRRQAAGQVVAMVGDGVNDAPALALAHLGIAMGGGTDAAIAAAAVSLIRPEPMLAAALIDIARATRRKIVQNLVWAFGFNLLAIPLAAIGVLGPVVAAAAMTISSLTVVANALSLRLWRPPGEN
ncbi:MAG: cation-translocating P-type ATPase [Rhodospirillaceae bacterium]